MDQDHLERLVRLGTRLEAMLSDFDEMKDDVRAIRTKMDQASGSWKTLVAIGTLLTAVSSALTTIILKFGGALRW